MANQAARRGAGLTMGNIVVLADDLAAGRLVMPFKMTIEPLAPYWLSCRSQRAGEPRSWRSANG